jgi:purine-binding chemotaxis protein CheW
MSKQLFCSFHLGRLLMGVHVLEVQEVIRFQPMQRVPHAPPIVRGLINLRGQIVTVLDLRMRLGLPPCTSGDAPMNIVLKGDGATVSLLVDRVGDILELDDAQSEPPPETLRGKAKELVQSVYKLDSSLMLVLDIPKAIDIHIQALPAISNL